jgi:hypothetical protein
MQILVLYVFYICKYAYYMDTDTDTEYAGSNPTLSYPDPDLEYAGSNPTLSYPDPDPEYAGSNPSRRCTHDS